MKINAKFVEKILTSFIKEELGKFGFSRGILGLSGGLDSTTSAFLAAGALGPDKVYGMILPYEDSYREDIVHAEQVAEQLGIHMLSIDISPMVKSYFQEHPTENRILKGNKMARERMSILYDYSARNEALIIGTSNKTELLLGYGTIHGDMACAINPIGDLFKTQIRQLAAHLGVPDKIITKAPTAGLWPGQTDEDELGMSYETIDKILYQLIDIRKSREAILNMGFKEADVDRIIRLIKGSEFKRKLPPIAKLSDRTVGLDFLYPFDRDR